MLLRTKLTEKLGISHPILLAPMGTASGGALARAVTEAGGSPVGFVSRFGENIRHSSDLANPLSRSQHQRADSDGCAACSDRS